MREISGGEELRHALQELAAFGSPVDLSVAEENLSLHIQQVGGLSDSIIFDLPNHRTGYVLDIEVLNRRPKTIYPRDLELQLPWEDLQFQWLPDPGTQNHKAKKAQGKRLKTKQTQPTLQYCFPDSGGLEYSRNQVLNHYLAENGKLTKKPMRGLLLAIGARMPFGLRHGSLLEASLVLRDVECITYRGAVTFWVERRDVIAKPRTRNLGLFEPARANYGPRIADPRPTRRPLRELIGRSKPRAVGQNRCTMLPIFEVNGSEVPKA